ncbi:uncharacterized protein PITG_15431 [Phytophthora infestans T30-4]|uniref:Uncharacterized protein n=1 Tax=Phytophthora infestans (strain T30-4) TaxID=403677 RepID=D0NR84_PHYIT|nr:uncharacterized protein PITG_15431 [Phytophthora infestans T30-4]EEY63206.1 hypothetical protein PITG_15431 [Phytophthora infestans T30-4]|eukprot:XP_002898383.1 hypothetical protein PITG_15431 [Phytophthora infestans T30-4]
MKILDFKVRVDPGARNFLSGSTRVVQGWPIRSGGYSEICHLQVTGNQQHFSRGDAYREPKSNRQIEVLESEESEEAPAALTELSDADKGRPRRKNAASPRVDDVFGKCVAINDES